MSYNYLFTVPYMDLFVWDVKRFYKNEITSKYPVEPLGWHINEENTKMALSDYPDKKFDILGVTNSEGIIDAYSAQGKTFNQSYKIMNKDFIAYNPYRVNVGSIGIKKEQKGNLISPAYVVFSCKNTILPDYLFLLMKGAKFNGLVRQNTSGSVRQNLTFKALSRIRVPVPSIEEQQKLLYEYQCKLSKSLSMDTEEIEKINEYLFSVLKIELSRTTKNSLLSFIDFSEISRWDAVYLKSLTNVLSNAPLREIGKFIKYWQCDSKGGIAIKTNSLEFCDDTFHYIGMENVEKNSGKLCALPCVKGRDIKSTTLMVPKGFIIYNKLRPYLNKFWQNNTDYEDVICSSEFFVFETNENINKEYFLFVLSSNIVQEQLNRNYSGTRMPRITKEVFFDVKIPLPPIEDQLKIVYDLKCIKEIAQTNKKSAELILRQAKQDFENAIF